MTEKGRTKGRTSWPLLVAIALHGLVLAWAGATTFSRWTERAEEGETFAVTLARAEEAPRREPEFAELEFDAAEEVLEPSLPDLSDDEFLEPEVQESELWSAVIAEPEEPPLPELKSVDFTLPDPLTLGQPSAAMGKAGASSIGVGTRLASGSGGSARTGAGVGSQDGGTGTGRGSGAPVVASQAPPPRVVEAVALETPPPPYPRLSQRSGEEGNVLCRLHLSALGTVTAVDVVESSGHARLDDAAREALLSWRFQPRSEGGRAVATALLHRVIFRLEQAAGRAGKR